jgi:hypothetical protein
MVVTAAKISEEIGPKQLSSRLFIYSSANVTTFHFVVRHMSMLYTCSFSPSSHLAYSADEWRDFS